MPRTKSAMASSAYTKPRYMKLLVSNRTKTFVPVNASGLSTHDTVSFRRVQHGAGGAVCVDGHGRVRALGERSQLLQDSIFVDTEIRRLHAVDVMILAVGDLEVQHHHVHLHPENGALVVLRMNQKTACCGAKESSSRYRHGLFPAVSSGIPPSVRPSYPPARACGHRPPPGGAISKPLASLPGAKAKICSTSFWVHSGINTLSCAGETLTSSASPHPIEGVGFPSSSTP